MSDQESDQDHPEMFHFQDEEDDESTAMDSANSLDEGILLEKFDELCMLLRRSIDGQNTLIRTLTMSGYVGS